MYSIGGNKIRLPLTGALCYDNTYFTIFLFVYLPYKAEKPSVHLSVCPTVLPISQLCPHGSMQDFHYTIAMSSDISKYYYKGFLAL